MNSSLEAQLNPDEELVWAGRANSDRLLRRSDYVAVWSGILLGTVAMAAFIAAIVALIGGSGTGGVIGLLLAAVLGAIALYLVFGRFARRFGRTRRAAYGITTSRVISMRGPAQPGGDPVIEQLAIAPGIATRLTTHYDGRGTITVGGLSLENIDDAAVVYELLQAQIARQSR